MTAKIEDPKFVAQSACMRKIFEMIDKVALAPSNVLICGESGTGKELVARSIHARSQRANERFVSVNCAGLPGTLIESELFGHEKGAFTGAHARAMGKFEYADRGTLFLDEISSMPLELQAKLLRVLQEREVVPLGGNNAIRTDVRIIAATNVRPEQMAEEAFRKDLYFRLNVIRMGLPRLRERKGDIPLLANFFLDHFGKKMNRKMRGFTPEAMTMLEAHSWPGNVRELRNMIECLVVMGTEGEMIDEDLCFHKFRPHGGCGCLATEYQDRKKDGDVRRVGKNANDPNAIVQNCWDANGHMGLADTLRAFERRCVLNALAYCRWNRAKTAERLKIHRNTLFRRMRTLNISNAENALNRR